MKTIRTTPHRMGGLIFALFILCLINAKAWAAPAGNIDQAQNGGVNGTPINPVDWINGNSNAQKSHYAEGESIPYRLVLTDLALGSHVVDIEWDIRKSSKATIDYITSFQRINETVNPLKGLVGTFGAPSTFPIPPPPVSTTTGTVGGQPQPLTSFNGLAAAQRLFTIYNGTITAIQYINNADGNLGSWSVADSSQRIRITLQATSSQVVLAWGGHIASRRDWGDGNSANAVPGSPYHTRFIALDGKGGNQDLALAAAAVCLPPNCAVSGPTTVCPTTPYTYTAQTDGTANTFLWTITGNGSIVGSNTGPSVQVASGAPGAFTLTVTISRPLTAGGCSTTCSQTVTVNGLPSCSITRLNDPSSQNIGSTLYQGPAGMANYSWTVSYNGDPAATAGGNQPSISLADPTAQGGQTATVTVGLTVTDIDGCTSSCVRTFETPGECILKPEAACPRSTETFTYGGDPTGMTFLWSIVTPGSPVTIVGANNQPTVDVTSPVCTDFILRLEVTAPDGFVTICETTGAFVDTTRPVLGNLPLGGDLGCNPTLPTCSQTVTALDDCDGDISGRVVCTPGPIVENGACSRQQTFTYSVTDSCGNTTSAAVSYTWKQDTTAPVFSNLPASGDLGCNPPLPRCSETVTALDDCDGNLTAEIVCTPGDVIETSACGRSRTFVYTVSDACGNVARASVTLTWREDNTPPVLANLPTGEDLGCNPATLPTCSRTVTANDLCDGDVTASVVCTPGPIISLNGCQRSQTFTYTAQDTCGNQVRNEVNYTWKQDTTAPVFSNLPVSGDLGCNPPLPRCSEAVTALDDCDGNLTAEIVCTPGDVIETSACGRSRTFVYTVSDACGNVARASVTLTWREDNTSPVLANLPNGGDLGCNPTLPTCSRAVTATDLCDGDLTASVVCTPGPIISINGCQRSQTFTYTVQDTCGNQVRNEVNYTWREDTIPPELGNLPTGGDLGCDPTRPSCSALVTARDNCDGDLSAAVVCTPGTVETLGGCRFSQVFTYTVQDRCGNVASARVLYTWRDDNIAPVMANLPVGGDLGCNPVRPTCSNAVTARDDCDGDLTGRVICIPGPVLDVGTCGKRQSFRYQVSDACGNAASVEIEYAWREDLTPPVLGNLPAGGDLGCNPTRPSCSTAVTARDNCDGDLSARVSCTAGPIEPSGNCGFTQAFTYTVQDTCGNQSQEVVTYTWREDTIAPVMANLPAGGDLGCNPVRPTCSRDVTARDNCDGDLTAAILCTPGPIVDIGTCGKSQEFTYQVQDACGNLARVLVTYTWREDTLPPVLGNLPVGGDLGCNPTRPTCSDLVTARDNCDDDLSAAVVCTPGQIQTVNGCGFTQVFNYTVRDTCGNQASIDVVYNWREDTTAPELGNLPPGGDLGCNPIRPTCSTAVVARDLCDGDLSGRIVCEPGPITDGPLCRKTQFFSYSVSDRCGNRASAEVTYTWIEDRIPPVIVCPSVQSPIECPATPEFPEATVSDDCDPAPRMVFTDRTISGACPQSYQVVRTWTATDACGNTSSCSVTIEVRDTLPPIVAWPGDVNLACTDCDIDPANTGEPTAEDLCGTITITHTDTITGTCPKRVERRWTVSDGCNEVSYVQVIQCLPSTRVVVTDSSLCTYDNDPTTRCKDFRLLFTQDAQNFPQYRLNASNPGQTYFNLFYNGRPGTVVTLNLTIPYPFVTQGAQPIHAYDSVTVVTGSNGQECYIPGNGFFVDSTQITLSNYAPQAVGSSTTVSVTLTVPASGFVYLNMHLDYGLKRSTGYAKGGPSGNDAIDPTSLQVLIPDRGSYSFAFSDGMESASDSICNLNVFKKVAGVGGLATKRSKTFEGEHENRQFEGCKVALKDAKGQTLVTGKTDPDGWYFCNYKWTGKATTLYLTLTPPGGTPQTLPVTLKANGYAQVDFDVP